MTADRGTSDHAVADYLAGYAEALADAATEPNRGVTDE